MTHVLSSEQIAILERGLQQRLADLHERMKLHHGGASRAEHAHEVLAQDGDDAPQRASDREVDLAISDMEAVEQSKLNAALARLGRADFGVCVTCGTHIAFERLLVEPTTQRCVACKSKAE